MALSEIKLTDIDFESVEACSEPRVLRRYITLLEEDGGYFHQLLHAARERLATLTGRKTTSTAKSGIGNNASAADVAAARQELLDWQRSLNTSLDPTIWKSESTARWEDVKVSVSTSLDPTCNTCLDPAIESGSPTGEWEDVKQNLNNLLHPTSRIESHTRWEDVNVKIPTPRVEELDDSPTGGGQTTCVSAHPEAGVQKKEEENKKVENEDVGYAEAAAGLTEREEHKENTDAKDGKSSTEEAGLQKQKRRDSENKTQDNDDEGERQEVNATDLQQENNNEPQSWSSCGRQMQRISVLVEDEDEGQAADAADSQQQQNGETQPRPCEIVEREAEVGAANLQQQRNNKSQSRSSGRQMHKIRVRVDDEEDDTDEDSGVSGGEDD